MAETPTPFDEDAIRSRIAQLPAGSISYKNIKGKQQPYLQWTEKGRTKSRYLKADERDEIIAQVAERKRLEAQLAEAESGKAAISASRPDLSAFETNCLTGELLTRFAAGVKKWRRRACFKQLEDYLRKPADSRILIVYGLRRTGKSTMLRQAILQMSEDERSRTAYITITPADTLAALNRDLRRLANEGFSSVFIDEVTMLDDFIESASLFSDIYAAMGMKIVLSGTDSLGFMFSEDEQLYDRCTLLHTTLIPYREFERVLGISGIDEYIRYGGTMSMSGVDYNTRSPFASAKSASEYVDSAIARNIQHSLQCYQHGGHFRKLQDLYDNDELTNTINRVVEDINHRFTVDVLTRDFISNDLALSAKNLRRDPNGPSDVLDHIDVTAVTKKLKESLHILNEHEQRAAISSTHAAEIREYLDLLDLTASIPIIDATSLDARNERVAVTQPGLRYAQAKALIEALASDNAFREAPLAERRAVVERILSEVRGRMLEDIVLIETQTAHPEAEVFKLQFAIGEFDMVVFHPEQGTCSLFEVKHSDKTHAAQRRHLLDPDKLKVTEMRYGPIQERCVLYRGEATKIDGVHYLNVEDYLRSLGGRKASLARTIRPTSG